MSFVAALLMPLVLSAPTPGVPQAPAAMTAEARSRMETLLKP